MSVSGRSNEHQTFILLLPVGVIRWVGVKLSKLWLVGVTSKVH